MSVAFEGVTRRFERLAPGVKGLYALLSALNKARSLPLRERCWRDFDETPGIENEWRGVPESEPLGEWDRATR
jgi:hypothetical protein